MAFELPGYFFKVYRSRRFYWGRLLCFSLFIEGGGGHGGTEINSVRLGDVLPSRRDVRGAQAGMGLDKIVSFMCSVYCFS